MTAWTKGLWTPSKGLARKPDDPYPFKSIFVEVEAQALPMEVARVYGQTEKEINANAELVAAAAYPRDPMAINGALLAVQNWDISTGRCREIIAQWLRGDMTWELPPMSDDIPDEPAEAFREMRDALENLIIAIGMGWDLDGVVDVGQVALRKARGETP